MSATIREIPLRVHEFTPEQAAEWDAFDVSAEPGMGRVSCLDCLNRAGTRCEALNTQHVPLALAHRCAHFRGRKVA